MQMAKLMLVGTLLSATFAMGADLPKPQPTPDRVMLPQEQQYQRVLRQYLATLTEKDFEHGVTDHLSVPPANPNPEYQYRTRLMAMLQQPHVGGKRGIPAVNAPSHNFLLSTIEGKSAVVVPPVWPEALATFIQWDSAGNVYHNNKALKMRAFVTSAVMMMMVDDFLDANASTTNARADWNGYHLINTAGPYPVFKNELPPEVRKAYEEGLLRLGRKVLAMGPRGAECDYEMGAAVGLWYVAHATGDAQFTQEAEAYARKLCTDPRYLHPAGYWVEGGGLDVGFGGMANFWTVWLAMASDWPFAKQAVDQAYRLRAHLSLPEPDGRFTGPSAFNNRLGSPACEDQWHWDGTRDHAAAQLTDEAVCMIQLPTQEQLAGAMALRTHTFNEHLYGNLRNAPYTYPDGKRYNEKGEGRYLENSELRGHRWVWRIFPNGFNYPIEVNPGYEFYRQGAYAHLMDLQKQNSPLLHSPYIRPGQFIRNFGDAFIAAKKPSYAALLHIGPVGDPAPDEPMAFYKGLMGFGGGQLSAFWTPDTGSVLLGRRGGLVMRGEEAVNFDKFEAWRTWPIHAVSGVTTDGKVFTSARIAKPTVSHEIKAEQADVKVSGVIPAGLVGQEGGLKGKMAYTRAFKIDDQGVRIETTVTGDGQDRIAELSETLPIFIEASKPAKDSQPPAVAIEFQADGSTTWSPATDTWTQKVQAVRVTRYNGAVLIRFDQPRRVKLSPEEWKDTFLTRAVCRNVMIDLMESNDQPTTLTSQKAISYQISATTK